MKKLGKSKNFNIFKQIYFFGFIILFLGCSDKTWKDFGDSCIQTSESPPLKRVINYTDHDLCDRKLSPRVAPNPRIRKNEGKS